MKQKLTWLAVGLSSLLALGCGGDEWDDEDMPSLEQEIADLANYDHCLSSLEGQGEYKPQDDKYVAYRAYLPDFCKIMGSPTFSRPDTEFPSRVSTYHLMKWSDKKPLDVPNGKSIKMKPTIESKERELTWVRYHEKGESEKHNEELNRYSNLSFIKAEAVGGYGLVSGVKWRKGKKVTDKATHIARGTVIATFDKDNTYSAADGHVAFFLGDGPDGFSVIDQNSWGSPGIYASAVKRHKIWKPKNGENLLPTHNADNYYVVEALFPYKWPFKDEDVEDKNGSHTFGDLDFHEIHKGSKHKGIDFKAKAGNEFSAIADGEVVKIGNDGCLGHYIVVKHYNQNFSLYAHMDKEPDKVREGTVVRRGEPIGEVGDAHAKGQPAGTCAEGSHLHLATADSVAGLFSEENKRNPKIYIKSHKE